MNESLYKFRWELPIYTVLRPYGANGRLMIFDIAISSGAVELVSALPK
jgi:hypothetical protein